MSVEISSSFSILNLSGRYNVTPLRPSEVLVVVVAHKHLGRKHMIDCRGRAIVLFAEGPEL